MLGLLMPEEVREVSCDLLGWLLRAGTLHALRDPFAVETRRPPRTHRLRRDHACRPQGDIPAHSGTRTLYLWTSRFQDIGSEPLLLRRHCRCDTVPLRTLIVYVTFSVSVPLPCSPLYAPLPDAIVHRDVPAFVSILTMYVIVPLLPLVT